MSPHTAVTMGRRHQVGHYRRDCVTTYCRHHGEMSPGWPLQEELCHHILPSPWGDVSRLAITGGTVSPHTAVTMGRRHQVGHYRRNCVTPNCRHHGESSPGWPLQEELCHPILPSPRGDVTRLAITGGTLSPPYCRHHGETSPGWPLQEELCHPILPSPRGYGHSTVECSTVTS